MGDSLMKDFCHKGIVLEPSEPRWAFLFPGGCERVSRANFSMKFSANRSVNLSGELSGNFSVKGNYR